MPIGVIDRRCRGIGCRLRPGGALYLQRDLIRAIHIEPDLTTACGLSYPLRVDRVGSVGYRPHLYPRRNGKIGDAEIETVCIGHGNLLCRAVEDQRIIQHSRRPSRRIHQSPVIALTR